jgi:hypothetical protein
MNRNFRVILVAAFALLIAVGLPTLAEAQKQTCFCCSPWPSKGAATGKKANSRNKQSTVSISFYVSGVGRITATNNPSAGDTCEAIMQDLANQLTAAGFPAGPVGVNPDNGRAVFCIDGRHWSSTKENDTGIREVTWRTVSKPTDPFLRGVVFAYVDDSAAEGGYVELELYAQLPDDEAEITINVVVETYPGQTGAEVNEALIAGLEDAGFEAWLGSYDFYPEDGEEPAIFVDRGIYGHINGIGMIAEDEGLNITATAGFEPGPVVVGIPDVGGDGTVDNADFQAFLEAYAAGSRSADLNGDGVVDSGDLAHLFNSLSSRLYLEPNPGLEEALRQSAQP